MDWFWNAVERMGGTLDDIKRAADNVWAWIRDNYFAFGILLFAVVAFLLGIYGSVQTILLFFDPSYQPWVVGMLLASKLVALGASLFGLALLFTGNDKEDWAFVFTGGAWAANYFKPLFLWVLSDFHLLDSFKIPPLT
ncbi:hypothetical protein [Rhizobium phaseoli]|uniref:hypothetical protein n=1 Tax=Rhizobium phaseoli TaxID=396 RepID=UPI000BEA6597|nr:hypothetical protein [Rhizobium phaseoli]PDS68681.1 hypothetical protein CO651_28130 [Rhizobium phaseoli]